MKYLSILSILFLSILLVTNCGKNSLFYENGDAFVQEVEESVVGVHPEKAKEMMDTSSFYVLLDVREPDEHHPGYIPGSVNLPRGILEFNVTNPKYWESLSLYQPYKTDLVIVYCKKGKRSILASSTLQKMGFTNVVYIIGGFKNWELTYPNDYDFDEVDQGHGEPEKEVGGC